MKNMYVDKNAEVSMKVVIAIDSFKGSLSSMQAGKATKEGVLSIYPQADVIVKPLADGGEGTVYALADGMNGELKTAKVTGPLGDTVKAHYALLPQSGTAILEMAQAAGLPMVPYSLRDPRLTTTYGVGELIKNAIENGYRKFIIGIGGSATNDAGIGMLQALGFEFFDAAGLPVAGIGASLAHIKTISSKSVLKELSDCTFNIACDVNNPLFGTNGAAHIYGPQKGATPEIVAELDAGLKNFAEVVHRSMGKDPANLPGAGAAGGLGYAFIAFLNSKLASGIHLILEEIALEELMRDADLVITGEGRLDAQTAMGKAPIGVAKLAKKHGAKVVALAGCTTDDAVQCNYEGIDAYFSIANAAMTLQEAMDTETAYRNVRQTTAQIFRLIKSVKD